jgi:SAM-dependent methyltransferase
MSFAPVYEIEVELDRGSLGDKDAYSTLMKGVGEILRGIQGNPILISKAVKESVLNQYEECTKTKRFRGVKPSTLEYKNMTGLRDPEDVEPNIRDDYNVTDKADGLRVHAFCDKEGELFMIDMAMNVLKTGLKNPKCKMSLLDGEYVTQNKMGKATQDLLFFDIYYEANGVDVSSKPFKTDDENCRYDDMNHWFAEWSSDGGPTKLLSSANIVLSIKNFYFADSKYSIFDRASLVLQQNALSDYTTDGLIFTPNALGLPSEPSVGFPQQFKWKPAEDNTIDFLVVTEKDENDPEKDKVRIGIHPQTDASIEYKTLFLLVGSREDPVFRNPRETILYKKPILDPRKDQRGPRMYSAVPFIPREYPDANAAICNLNVERDPKTGELYVKTERTEEPIRDMSIVEMRYVPANPPGWRWIPIRVRSDKTDRLMGGQGGKQGLQQLAKSRQLMGTLNSEKTAENVWNSIHNPVTVYMISTGNETPTEEEKEELNIQERTVNSKYYEKKEDRDDKRYVQELLKFHNKYIKDEILYPAIKTNTPNPVLIDVAVGRANDLHKWRRIGAKFVLGVDKTGDCCLDHLDGGYYRLLSTLVDAQKRRDPLPTPPMVFVIGDSSLRYQDGSAGANDAEADMLRKIIGHIPPIGPVPPYVSDSAVAGRLKDKADAMVCMYAMHYFFENKEKLNGLLQNIADNLKIGGYFVGTNFDGHAVFNLLRGVQKGETRVGKLADETTIWEITKEYESDPTDDYRVDDSAFGKTIDVKFISIGLKHREYLVPWELLVAKLKTIGCELCDRAELGKLGLQNSSAMYSTSHAMASKNPKYKSLFAMNPQAQEYSFLHRWYIFKRTSQGSGEIGEVQIDLEGDMVNTNETEEGVTSEVDIAQEQAESVIARNRTAYELSQRIQNSASTGENIVTTAGPLAPAAEAALARTMKVQFDAARTAGNMDVLAELDRRANLMIARQTQGAIGVRGGPPGTIVKDYLSAFEVKPKLTVPVQTPPELNRKRNLTIDRVLKFNENSPMTLPNLELRPEIASYAGRYLAPNAPFPILDPIAPMEAPIQYPSILHFLGGKMVELATALSENADLFTSKGKIHTEWNAARQAARGPNMKITEDDQRALLLRETEAVQKQILEIRSDPRYEFDSAKWQSLQVDMLQIAIGQRLEKDKRFCAIVSKATEENKYLLYASENKELGGIYNSKTRKVDGVNLYGTILMDIVALNPSMLSECMSGSNRMNSPIPDETVD